MDKPLIIRGTGRLYTDNSFEFTPQKEGNPQRADVVKTAAATLYSTTGKKPKKVVTVQYDPTDADPLASVHDEVDRIFAKANPKIETKAKRPKGRALLGDDNCSVRFNDETMSLDVRFSCPLTITDGKDYKTNFYEILQKLSKCLVYNTDFLNKQLIATVISSKL